MRSANGSASLRPRSHASNPTPPAGATVELDDERILQEVGIYRYHHPLEKAAEYKTKLDELSQQIKTMVTTPVREIAVRRLWRR